MSRGGTPCSRDLYLPAVCLLGGNETGCTLNPGMGTTGPQMDNEDNLNHVRVSLSRVLGERTPCFPFPFTSSRQVSFPHASSPSLPSSTSCGLISQSPVRGGYLSLDSLLRRTRGFICHSSCPTWPRERHSAARVQQKHSGAIQESCLHSPLVSKVSLLLCQLNNILRKMLTKFLHILVVSSGRLFRIHDRTNSLEEKSIPVIFKEN